MKDKVEIIRAVTRALGFLLPLGSLCAAMFVLDGDIKQLIIGGLIGGVGTASVFYFKKDEELNDK